MTFKIVLRAAWGVRLALSWGGGGGQGNRPAGMWGAVVRDGGGLDQDARAETATRGRHPGHLGQRDTASWLKTAMHFLPQCWDQLASAERFSLGVSHAGTVNASQSRSHSNSAGPKMASGSRWLF